MTDRTDVVSMVMAVVVVMRRDMGLDSAAAQRSVSSGGCGWNRFFGQAVCNGSIRVNGCKGDSAKP